MSWFGRLLLVGIVLGCVAVAVVGGRAQAAPLPPNDPCLLIAPDKTISVSIDGVKRYANSVTADYANRAACPYFVVDIYMPAGNGTWNIWVTSPSWCMTEATAMLYVKGPFSSAFSHATGAGSGISLNCAQPVDGTSSSLVPGMWGFRTWRVLARATYYFLNQITLPRPVTVGVYAS